MSQLVCKNLSLGYEDGVVTRNINFRVNKGDYLCIVGENGSGKSTLAKALLGLIKPLEGSIESSGLKIGYLPQQTEISDDFPASVKEVVLSGFANASKSFFYGKKERVAAIEMMKKLGIYNLASKCFRDLSGGQKQRVFLARALCAADDILLLDEPVTGLDPSITAELYKILEKLNKTEKMTVVMISHDIHSSLKYATHILHIGEEQLFFGSVGEYIKSDAINNFSECGGVSNE